MQSILDILRNQALALLDVIPSLVKAFVIFLVGYILARIIAKIIKKLLAAIGIDRAAEKLNDVDLVSKSKIKIVPSTLFSRIIYYLLLFMFVMAAVDALGMRTVTDLMARVVDYIPKALAAFLVLLIGILVCDLIKKIVLTTCQSLGIPAAKLIANAVFYFLFLNVIMITLKQAELQTTFMETNISIVLAGIIFAFAIGYGLASRPLMANLLSAFYNKDRLVVGDTISIEDVKGEIIAMDSTTLTIQTDTNRVIIPLSKFSNEKFVIHDRKPPNRLPSEITR